MFRKWLIAVGAPILAVAALAFSSSPALARGHGGGHVGHVGHAGGWHGAGYRGWHGAYGRGWYGHGYYGRGWGGGYPWYGFGLGVPGYFPYYSGYYDYPATYQYVPTLATESSPVYYSSGEPATQAADNSAHLNVQVPANAQVWIEGAKTTQTGTDRLFTSPPLTPGTNYSYDVRARWLDNGKPVDRTKTVVVHAGDRLDVNMMAGAASQ
jgi:uncharacterized protein (TIGR03000 family)